MSKRVWKLQDFVAHPGKASCARLGEKSGQVLATGGEDKRVNIWKVGKPNPMMSLTGHTTSVDCLVFDKQEEVLVVGCGGGSMQVWNLEYRKMAGTLPGHRAACASIEFHPYGEFFASGSVDTNLKIWDLRRKSCIQTYKGHTGTVTSIRFSPHGRWVATGGQDSQVKIWDLTAGKLMRDLDLHKGPITSLAFHPKEYLLATGSADRTMKLWSLETFRAVGSTELGSSQPLAVKFYVEEQTVISASSEAVRVYSTDNLTHPVDSIEVDWRGLQDLRLCSPEEKLIAVATEGSQLGIWVADLQRREAAVSKASSGGYRPRGLGMNGSAAMSVAQANVYQEPGAPMMPTQTESADDEDVAEKPVEQSPTAVGSRSSAPSNSPSSAAVARHGSSNSFDGHLSEPGSSRPEAGHRGLRNPAGQRAPLPEVVPPVPPGAMAPSSSSSAIPRQSGIDLDQVAVANLAKQHPQMLGVLQRRIEQSRRLQELWAKGNLAGLDSIIAAPQDHAVFCDFARVVIQQKLVSTLNLDACHALLCIVRELIASKYQDFVETALRFAELLLEHFGDIISDTRQSCANIPERHLDLAREERLRKCNACYELFQQVSSSLSSDAAGLQSALHRFLQRSRHV